MSERNEFGWAEEAWSILSETPFDTDEEALALAKVSLL